MYTFGILCSSCDTMCSSSLSPDFPHLLHPLCVVLSCVPNQSLATIGAAIFCVFCACVHAHVLRHWWLLHYRGTRDVTQGIRAQYAGTGRTPYLFQQEGSGSFKRNQVRVAFKNRLKCAIKCGENGGKRPMFRNSLIDRMFDRQEPACS